MNAGNQEYVLLLSKHIEVKGTDIGLGCSRRVSDFKVEIWRDG